MADERGAAVLRADAALCREAWRCPFAGGESGPLDDAHQIALRRASAVVGCAPGELTTCPGHYARTPEAHELVNLLRWQEKGQLHLRVPNPTGVLVDALDAIAVALAARERDELDRARRDAERKRASDGR